MKCTICEVDESVRAGDLPTADHPFTCKVCADIILLLAVYYREALPEAMNADDRFKAFGRLSFRAVMLGEWERKRKEWTKPSSAS